MAHYNRPVKTNQPNVVAYPASGIATIHADGCSHATGSRVWTEAVPFTYDFAGSFADDWYNVAPCAADGKGRVCTSGGVENCDH